MTSLLTPASDGVQGPGGDDDSLRRELFDFGNGDLVVAHDMEVRPQLAEILDEVVGEAVVVIEDEDHDGSTVRARSMARMTPMALLIVSSYSPRGVLSATTPAPAWT